MSQNIESEWIVLTEVTQPDEAQLLSGLLNSANIPMRFDRDAAGNIYGLTIGPLASIKILVPRSRQAEAEKILADFADSGDNQEP